LIEKLDWGLIVFCIFAATIFVFPDFGDKWNLRFIKSLHRNVVRFCCAKQPFIICHSKIDFFPNSENCIIPRKYKKMVHFSISQSPTIFIVAVEMQILSFKLHFHFIGKLLKFAFAFVQHTLVNYNKNKEPIVMINLKTGYNK
jgi:hypothetical protein